MKNLLRIILILAVAVIAFILIRSKEKPAATQQSASAAKPTAPTVSNTDNAPEASVPAKTSLAASPTGFLASDVMAKIRAVMADKDRVGYDEAYKGLVDYINAHPEEVDNYVAVLRTEQDEHVLRTFAIALAETEVGLLANDKIIGASIDLAKDSSFEQRQHIMLNLMSKFPEMRDDVYQTVLGLTQQDPNSQVKTSAVVVFADWMERLPEKKEMLIGQVGEVFKTAEDEDVRGFTYQVLALHREDLSREMQLALGERLKTEPDSFSGNLLAMALSAAPDDIRQSALAHVQSAFDAEKDTERQRNLLAQIVCLANRDCRPLLQRTSVGESLLAQDSRRYIALLASPEPFNPELVLQEKAIIDATHAGLHEIHKD